MTQNLSRILIVVFCLMICTTALAQEKYYTLKWDREAIKDYMENKNCKRFVFVFLEKPDHYFVLQGAAYDGKGNIIGKPFELTPLTASGEPAPLDLVNYQKGIFRLKKHFYHRKGIRGYTDVYFKPIQSGDELKTKYVSYEVSQPGKVTQMNTSSGVHDLATDSFTMNPSPPYKTGHTR